MRELTQDIAFSSRPQPEGFLAGVAFAATALALSVRAAILMRGEAAATASDILASEQAGRLGLFANLIGAGVYGAMTFVFHAALAPVQASLSLLSAFVRLARAVVAADGLALSLAPVLLRAGEHAFLGAMHQLFGHLF
jgi:uncharacterized protein DUF4386